MSLASKTILVTGAARRVGKALALAAAHAGANVVLHYGHSHTEAQLACREIEALGVKAWLLAADLGDLSQAAGLIERAWQLSPLDGLVNSAAIFEPLSWNQVTPQAWQRHLDLNLSAPFLLSQAFARQLGPQATGRIVNILDWRALRPGSDHLPYTISKAALAALTRSLAAAFAPRIQVNGLALGAILPPNAGSSMPPNEGREGTNLRTSDVPQTEKGALEPILKDVPARRWATLDEVGQALVFLLDGPAYITGEIIHVDGGRHLI